ncbi:endonuclease/exonuclease/phosphatase family protein [Peijinzhouia sedimentorum]
MDTLAVIILCISIFPTLASLIKWDDWWIRIFDFPRVQIAVIQIIILFIAIWLIPYFSLTYIVLFAVAVLSFLYQLVKIFPYTNLARQQVLRYKGNEKSNNVSILVSNVLETNRDASKLLSLINQYKPDILLTLESDDWWEAKLSSIEKDYPYTVKKPLKNLYGIHLYSKLELIDTEIKYVVDDEIPSIHGYVKLRSGRKVKIHCLHPTPPSPTERETSTDRDAELLIVGKNVDAKKEPTLVFGDLNDVAWSRTTRLFQQLSGLLDPRIGRGFYSTFHADYRLLRWPLDHIFLSPEFKLIEIRRLPHIGSDHFPFFAHLHLVGQSDNLEEAPEVLEEEEEEWVEKKIKKAEPLQYHL